MTDVTGLIRSYIDRSAAKAARKPFRSRQKYADGGDVTPESLIQEARLRLASQPRRVEPSLPDVGEPLVASGGEFSRGTEFVNRAAEAGSNIVSNAPRHLATLPRRAIESSEAMRRGEGYDPGPILEAATLPMGTGMAVGLPLRSGETALGAGVRTYRNVPDSLMGFRKSGQQKGFEETKYPFAQEVEVTLPATKYSPADTFRDQIKGMNANHAYERAWRNWPEAVHITPIAGFAEGGSVDLPDAPWATSAAPAPAASSDLPDAPWGANQPAAAPSERTWGDTARSAWETVSPVARQIPGPIGAVTRSVESIPLAAEAVSNIPKSAAQFGSDLVQPILHPIDTAESFKNLGLGVLEKTGILSGTEHEKYADAVGRFLADRYGGIENVKRTLATDPVGLAGDVSMILTGGGSAAARAPGIVGRVGEAARAAGTAIDPLRAVEAGVRGAGRVASEVLGVTTGAGGLPLRTAAQAGFEGGPGAQAFRENITGAAPLEQAVNEARDAVRHLRQERGAVYRQGMAEVGADATVLDFNRIDRAVAQAQGVKTYRGRSGTAQEQNLSPRTEGIRTEMENAIEHWRTLDPAEFHSPEGIDALKQQLGNIRDATQPHTPERVAADRIYNAVRQTIVDQVPEYAHVMQGYEQASNQIREIERTLSLNPNATIDTALRKLQSTLRDNVNTAFGRRTELADFLVHAGAPHLMQRLAGQALSAWAPRGLSRIAVTHAVPAIGAGLVGGALPAAAAAAATLPTMSPRLMGEAAYGVGRARRAAQPLAPVPRISRQLGEIARATEPFGASEENPYRP